mmetsp:Transcript_5915/g.12879  ORF Transcript_5915/g.12879 Transcript_5915/m.12879 type:complete len:209 (-) Transcript_5915:714-1340(-)
MHIARIRPIHKSKCFPGNARNNVLHTFGNLFLWRQARSILDDGRVCHFLPTGLDWFAVDDFAGAEVGHVEKSSRHFPRNRSGFSFGVGVDGLRIEFFVIIIMVVVSIAISIETCSEDIVGVRVSQLFFGRSQVGRHLFHDVGGGIIVEWWRSITVAVVVGGRCWMVSDVFVPGVGPLGPVIEEDFFVGSNISQCDVFEDKSSGIGSGE